MAALSRDTIFALSTAVGRAALAVVRLSGPQTAAALERLAGPLPAPRRAVLRRLSDPVSGEVLDHALLLWFPGPASYSGEDMAELQLHGGWAVIEGVLAALQSLPGLRPAEPGEFTRRAFDSGRLELTEVEGLADLIEAETAAQRRQALAQLGGGLAQRLSDWRGRLLLALAHLEAALDFPDEEVPPEEMARAAASAALVAAEVAATLNDQGQGERLRRGFTVVILGAPNAGKSSLLNALAGREAALVSARAGTTRDLIEVRLDLQGLPVTLVDTAGLSATPLDDLDAEAMRRARDRATSADLCLEVVDLSDHRAKALPRGSSPWLTLGSKADLRERAAMPVDLKLSVKSGAGLNELLQRLTEMARQAVGEGGALITRARQRRALEDCQAALLTARADAPPELLAEDLRRALTALGRVAGKVDVEELLDLLFRDFCIGK